MISQDFSKEKRQRSSIEIFVNLFLKSKINKNIVEFDDESLSSEIFSDLFIYFISFDHTFSKTLSLIPNSFLFDIPNSIDSKILCRLLTKISSPSPKPSSKHSFFLFVSQVPFIRLMRLQNDFVQRPLSSPLPPPSYSDNQNQCSVSSVTI